MCGRFAIFEPVRELIEFFGLVQAPEELLPAYNGAPTQLLPVVIADPEPRLRLFRWGLVPFWAKDLKVGARMINARAETVAEKPSFRDALKKRRCLVPASGYYEWQKAAGGKAVKQPHFIARKDGQPLAFAGLWEHWPKQDPPVLSFTIITTEANQALGHLHHRMPVILPREHWAGWLGPQQLSSAQLDLFLRPAPDDLLQSHAVSTRVNRASEQGPDLVKAI